MSEFNDKINKLIEYVKTEFPTGCGDGKCPEDCPLLNVEVCTIEDNICSILLNLRRNSRSS